MLLTVPQYKTTFLSVSGGIDASQTSGIVANNIDGVDATKPGEACLSWANPLDLTKAEYFTYTSINESTKEFEGVVRGREGISAKQHLEQAVIAWPVSANHINELNDGVLGITTYIADTGTADVYTISSPSITELVAGLDVRFKAENANTGASTIQINSLAVKAIKKEGTVTLAANDIKAGSITHLVYDGTNFQIVSGVATAGASYWTEMPGTPTRVSDTQFTITDTANAGAYDSLFKKGVILRWLESTTFQTAMVISSSYATNVVTINLVGDSLTAGFTAMKYYIQEAQMISGTPFIIAGTFPSTATTNISKSFTLDQSYYIISSDLTVDTAGSGTGSTVVDINLNGTTKFTTKPTLTTTGTADLDNVADTPSTAVAADVKITIDVDSVTATTAPLDGYVKLWGYPVSWRYR